MNLVSKFCPWNLRKFPCGALPVSISRPLRYMGLDWLSNGVSLSEVFVGLRSTRKFGLPRPWRPARSRLSSNEQQQGVWFADGWDLLGLYLFDSVTGLLIDWDVHNSFVHGFVARSCMIWALSLSLSHTLYCTISSCYWEVGENNTL